jgi:Flp pilus assembly protein TadD
MSTAQIQRLLREGIAAAQTAQQKQPPQSLSAGKDAQQERARQLLLQVVEIDRTNVQAWLWLSTVMPNINDKITCLNNVLALEPDHRSAKVGLAWLKRHALFSQPQTGVALLPPIPPDILQDAPGNQAVPNWETVDIYSSFESEPIMVETPPASTEIPQSACPFCHQLISSMDSTCPYCDAPLVMECPACNTLMDVEWPTCSQCGHPMGDSRFGSVYFAQLATGYQKYQQPAKALAALQIVEKINPDQPDLYRHMGEVQAELGEPGGAIATLEKAVEQEPDQVGPYLALGKVLQQEGRWKRAEKVYKQALIITPKSSEPYFALGDLLMQRGRLREARNHLQRATKLYPQHGLAWARLGEIHEASGRQQPAIRAYQQAVKFLSPESLEWEQVQQRLNVLNPGLSASQARGWAEFIRETSGPILVCVLALLLDSGLRPWWISGMGWLALILAMLGAFLWVSGTSLPNNPLMRLLIGQQGLDKSELRILVASLGALFWLLAMGIILLPLGQFFPEPSL